MLLGMADWIIIAVILLSTVISLWRGAAREVLSLVVWVAAFWIAFKFNALFEPALAPYVEAPELRFVISFVLIILVVVILGTIMGRILTAAINTVGLSGLDKILGMAFGCARGVLILAVFVVLARFTELPSEPWWENSLLIPHIEIVSDFINDWLNNQGFEPFQTSHVDAIIQPHYEG